MTQFATAANAAPGSAANAGSAERPPELTPLGAAYARALATITAAIADGAPVLCMGHIQPDGDALGSALALAMAVRQAGGDALVSFDPGPLPFGLPQSLRFLPGAELLVPPALLPPSVSDLAAIITFDTGSAERLGALAPLAVPRVDGPPVLAIDHHARGVAFGSVRLVDPAAAATAELVAELIDGLGVPFDRDIATCLYVGLASDTGSFRYAATGPQSHRLAARLVEAGAEHDVIGSLLWDTRPASYLTVLTGALSRLQREGQIIWTYVAARDLAAAGASAEEAEGVVDVIRVSRDHEVAVVLKQDPAAASEWKASVRSRGRVDVGAACEVLGGGGHRLSAGFAAAGEPLEIIARLSAALAVTAAP